MHSVLCDNIPSDNTDDLHIGDSDDINSPVLNFPSRKNQKTSIENNLSQSSLMEEKKVSIKRNTPVCLDFFHYF